MVFTPNLGSKGFENLVTLSCSAFHQAVEKTLKTFVRVAKILRVKLHTHLETAGTLQGLHRAVVGHRSHLETASDPGSCLVMKRVESRSGGKSELASMANATTGGDLELSEDGYRDEPDVLIT